jgi:hypothetical protein
MISEREVYATLDARSESLRRRRESLRLELRDTEAKLTEINDLRRDLGAPRSALPRPAPIQLPVRPGVNQFDWIIQLLKANLEGLSSLQILDYLEPKIRSGAKNRRKVLSSALSVMKNEGDIELVGGLYRISEKCSRL